MSYLLFGVVSLLLSCAPELRKDPHPVSVQELEAPRQARRHLIGDLGPACEEIPIDRFDLSTPYPEGLGTQTIADARCQYAKRRAHTMSYLVNKYHGSIPSNDQKDNRENFNAFINWAIPTMLLADPEAIKEIDRVLVESTAKPWRYGSSFDLNVANFICGRRGDYDFVAFNIAAIGILGQASHLKLSDGAINKLLSWLPEYGMPPKGHDLTFKMEGTICDGLKLNFPETENHIIMTQVARYLTNQLREGRNTLQFDRWMIEHLNIFLKNYFSEYNSRPYQTYALQPIMTLGALAVSKRVRMKARSVVQMVLTVVATQSNGYRRLPPFRRQPQYKDLDQVFRGDTLYVPLAYFSGYYEPILRYQRFKDQAIKGDYGDKLLTVGVLYNDVLLPDQLLDLVVSEQNTSYIQRYSYSGNQEIYAKRPNYLISAAGRFHRYEKCAEATLPIIFGCMTDEQHGFATKTMVVPTLSNSATVADFLHFKGHPKVKKRHNLCVSEDFLCGLNPVIPAMLADCPKKEVGAFTFLDLNTDEGVCALGFYAAIREDVCDSDCPEGVKSLGYMHLLHDPEVSLIEFAREVVAKNPGPLVIGSSMDFIKFDGEKVLFTILSEGRSSFVSSRPPKNWAEGDILRVDESGLKVSGPRSKKIFEIPF